MSVFSFSSGVDPSILLQHSQQQIPETTQEQSDLKPKLRIKKRAHNGDGQFRADNPSTVENEAWEQVSSDQTGQT